jgi:molybdate/tungstate transport system substrate-binding protein
MIKTCTVIIASLTLLGAGCGSSSKPGKKPVSIVVFHAGGITPVLEDLKADCEKELNIIILNEGTGSQVACHKVAELGRRCDLLLLADNSLVAKLLAEKCSWRLDFANDEVVLAVGQRARYTELLEKDWSRYLLEKTDLKLARVNESLGPIGYRTLMVWKLKESRGVPGLFEKLSGRITRKVDHVARLTPLLKSGEIDYAFVYRSICIAQDIRYISLGSEFNLGSQQVDYSRAAVTYKLPGTSDRSVTVKASPIAWTLTVPEDAENSAAALRFVNWMIEKQKSVLKRNGFRPLKIAEFFGSGNSARTLESLGSTCSKTGELN